MKIFYKTAAALILISVILFSVFYLSTFHPDEVQPEAVNTSQGLPLLEKGSQYKILSWNVQYMAGKNYVFFYDEWDGSGPDERPSSEDIGKTFKRAAEIIRGENPDVILLQEMDCGSRRTDYADQTAELLKLLPAEYSSWTTAWYWKAAFVPHPKIMGRVGMKLTIISKYRISRAVRYQLPVMPNNAVVRNLQFKRAVLEAVFPVNDGSEISVMTTHLDAFAQGSDTMQRQVKYISDLLERKNSYGEKWIITGDFNLLPPDGSYDLLPESEKPYFQKDTEMKTLYDSFNVLPALKNLSADRKKNFTHFANYNSAPDRTIDYIIHSGNLIPGNFHVRNWDTQDISDHFPLIMTFTQD